MVLAAVQVMIGGIAAPLLYLSDGQINVVVPMGLIPQSATTIQIVNASATLAAFPLAIDSSQPGIFPGVLNQDGTLNSEANPAKDSSFVSIYATGWQTSFAPLLDGQVATAANDQCHSSCTVNESNVTAFPYGGSVNLPVSYGGTAPGIVAGVSQFNIPVYSSNQPSPAQTSIYIYDLNASISVWVKR